MLVVMKGSDCSLRAKPEFGCSASPIGDIDDFWRWQKIVAEACERGILEEIVPRHEVKVVAFRLFREPADELCDGHRARGAPEIRFVVGNALTIGGDLDGNRTVLVGE